MRLSLPTKEVISGCDARGDSDSPYLTRFTLLNTRLGKLCLHIFHRSDSDELHDHPWSFWTLILWRGYLEETPDGNKRRVWPLMILHRRAKFAHRVELVEGRKAVTLVWMGARQRQWGFFTSKGWQFWKDYFKENGC